MKEPIWQPKKEKITASEMYNFLLSVKNIVLGEIEDYHDLYDWSISHNETFWHHLLVYSGIKYHGSPMPITNGKSMPECQWFPGVSLNFAANLLSRTDDAIAIIQTNELEESFVITYKELVIAVKELREFLVLQGVTSGDRIAGFVTNGIHAVIAMLASTSIGAIWSSCSPDFGLKGVVDRFSQIQPKILFAVSEYQYNGKKFDCNDKIKSITESLPSVVRTITYSAISKSYSFNIQTSTNASYSEAELSEFIASLPLFPFNHPVYIMYSSGTTGKPKCITHGAGGTLLQHFKELKLHTNVTEQDTIFYFTTCGWMMWNWLMSSLMIGARIVTYDGNPVYPESGRLWSMVDEFDISIFGCSPKYLSACEKSLLEPAKEFRLEHLHTILSTGSPLIPSNYQYVYRSIKSDVLLASISGGTDIISCFMLGNPMLPVYEGEIQCRGLGMAVESFDQQGLPVKHEKGELVCLKPAPSMPIYFWNDKAHTQYLNSYFNHFPGVWRHGDFIEITSEGGVIVHGRSDSTLNPGGVRIGASEIYSIVEALPYVHDSLVVGREKDGDVHVVLFVCLKSGVALTTEFIEEIKYTIRNNATPRHIPSVIVQVPDIPRTISGKKVEIAVSKILNGEMIDNLEALANPESLDYFKNLI